MSTESNVRQEVRDIAPEVVRLRREFHRDPEPGFAEERTAARVVAWLEACGGYRIRTGVAKTGVVADIRGGAGEGPWVLLRADMDALRLEEANEHLEYRSQNAGLMHACGHDAHMAILLGVARVLSRHRDEISGGVRLIFQPAEEGPGGAEPMIAAGVLKDPKPAAAFALHVWSRLPTGQIAVAPGPVMAYTDELRVRIRGKGGHGAVPQDAIDPIVAGAHFVIACQTIVSRSVNPLDSAVVSFGKVRSGSVMNAIAGELVIDGTQRALRPETRDTVIRRMREVARGLDETFGTRTEVELMERYPALVNDADMARLAHETAAAIVGAERIETGLRLMGGEDMAFYLQEVPGCFFFLGIGNDAKGCSHSHHNAHFNVDEDAFPAGVETLLRLTEHFVGPLSGTSAPQ